MTFRDQFTRPRSVRIPVGLDWQHVMTVLALEGYTVVVDHLGRHTLREIPPFLRPEDNEETA